jgi:hypothetical protein
MEPEVLSAIIAGSVSLLISTAVAAWTQRRKLESDFDAIIRTERLAEYRKLWQLMEPIGWYGKHEITAETAKKLLSDLDHWYFEGGGLLLSDISYDSFVQLLQALDKYDGVPEHVRPVGSKLRVALTYDVRGRSRPLLDPDIRQRDLERPDVMASRLSSK